MMSDSPLPPAPASAAASVAEPTPAPTESCLCASVAPGYVPVEASVEDENFIVQLEPEEAYSARQSRDKRPPFSLYLSGIIAANSRRVLDGHGCAHVLTIIHEAQSPDLPASHPDADPTKPTHRILHEGITYKRLPLTDDSEGRLAPLFADAHAFIDEAVAASSSVLVHCHAGVSRSASIVISYLMRKLGW